MSIAQNTSKFTKSKKKIQDKGGVINLVQDLSNKVQQLETRMRDMERNKQSNRPTNVRNLERKMIELEKKIKASSNSASQTPQASQNNNREMKMLNNVINEDLNKIKIKLEKHEDLIKKMLFN